MNFYYFTALANLEIVQNQLFLRHSGTFLHRNDQGQDALKKTKIKKMFPQSFMKFKKNKK